MIEMSMAVLTDCLVSAIMLLSIIINLRKKAKSQPCVLLLRLTTCNGFCFGECVYLTILSGRVKYFDMECEN